MEVVAVVVAWADCVCDEHAGPLAIGLRVDDPADDPVATDLGRRLLEAAALGARLLDERFVDGPESVIHAALDVVAADRGPDEARRQLRELLRDLLVPRALG